MRGRLHGQSGPTSWLPLAGDMDHAALCHQDVPKGLMQPPAAHPLLTIDAADRIVFVNDAWVRLARSMTVLPAQTLTLDTVLGRPIWDFIDGVQVRQLWGVLYERVRAVGAPAFVPMRADTPRLRRVFDVELHPLGERAIQHVYECAWTETRPAVALLDSAASRNGASLPCCAWCARIQVRAGVWEEIEVAQLLLQLDPDALPTLASAACTSCKQSLLRTFPARVA